MSDKKINILFAAGGTGGHLFPAAAVANYMRENYNEKVKSYFIGTENRIESIKVPQLGYDYFSMPITAFPGKNLKGLKYPLNMVSSINKARKVIKQNAIDAVVCTGAYISYPPGIAAKRLGRKLFLMESNVNPGKSILWLSKYANTIFSSYESSKNFFEIPVHTKIKCLGNPVREEILIPIDKQKAKRSFGFDNQNKTIFIFGGSLGARSINQVIEKHLDDFAQMKVNILWQTGQNYSIPKSIPQNIIITEFIDDMATAYAASDLVIARSGATTVAEISALGKASILVPLPSAANNEQYENARMLDDNDSAILIADSKINESLFGVISQMLEKEDEIKSMEEKIKKFARPNAVKDIAEEIIRSLSI